MPMRVTFLAHSGFLIELENILLLFDWWTGDLPTLPDKPLLVFASHSHEDHFSPRIFTLDNGQRDIHFLLGHDIALTAENQKLWQLSDNTLPKCTLLHGNETTSPLPGITVETLPSTDEGVAFLVSVDGKVIFHAGDLNWWHWEGEDPAWNLQMEQDFKCYAEPLTGRHIDLAMLPIDPRQDEDGFRGAAYILSRANIGHCLPMHQWEQFSFTQRFLNTYPQYTEQMIPVTQLGQIFTCNKEDSL